MLGRARKYPQKGWAGPGWLQQRQESEGLRSGPLKVPRRGPTSFWVVVCLQGHRPQLGGIYREPLVHIELVALS